MSDDRLALIREGLDQWLDTFLRRPGMLGPPEVINAVFYLYDGIDFIIKHGRNIDSGESLSWIAFLETKGYVKGSRNLLNKRLKQEEQEDAYKLLRELREEYYIWQASKLENSKNLP